MPHLLALEPRIMLDGAASATIMAETLRSTDSAIDTDNAHARLFDDGDAVDGARGFLTAADGSVDALADYRGVPVPNEVIFIDASVMNAHELADQWSDRGTVILVDADRDGIDQIRAGLAGMRGVEAIHIVSHGDDGVIWLGSTRIDAGAIEGELATSFAAIGRSLSIDGDILVYGCDFGDGPEGARAIAALAHATGADVAASTDPTGAAALGGDWDLEVRTGATGTALASGDYNFLLAPANSTAWTISGATSPATATATSDTLGISAAFSTVSGPANFTTISNGALNNINAFATTAAQGAPSLSFVFNWDTTPDTGLGSADGGVGLVTFTFAEAVTNPILNIDRLGGTDGVVSNSAQIAVLTAGIGVQRVSGVGHFVVNETAKTIVRTVNLASTGTESSLVSTTGTAAGSVRLVGTFTTVTLEFRAAPNSVEGGGGDGIELAFVADRAPIANNDAFTRAESVGSFTGNVLANNGSGADSDAGNDSLAVASARTSGGAAITIGTATTLPSGATLTLNANGSFSYATNGLFEDLGEGESRVETFSYVVTDPNGGSGTATATITITGQNDAPVNTLPASQTVAEDGAIVFSTANGNAVSISDVEGGLQTVMLEVPRGTLTLGSTTGLTFTSGDGTADATMTFSGTVAAINASLQGLRYVPLADFNGSTQLTIRTTNTPAAVAGFANGGFELPNFTGTPTFRNVDETLVPGWDTTAGDNLIEIWDSGFNNTPVGAITAFEGDQFAEINATQAGALFQTLTPVAGARLSVQFAHRGRQGTDVMQLLATDIGSDGVIGTSDDVVLFNENFTDANTAWGAYTRQLTAAASGNAIRLDFRAVSAAGGNTAVGNFIDGVNVTESLNDFDTLAINVTPVIDIAADSVTTPEDAAIVIDVLANDSFENVGRAVTAINGTAIATNGTVAVANGVVRLNTDGTLNFAPTTNYNGTTSFTYTVSSNLTTETATATVIVTPVNDAPTAVGTLPARTNLDASMVSIATAAAFADVDGSTLTYSAIGLPAGLTIDAATGVISGTIDRSASQPGGGVYAVAVIARDAGGLTATQNFAWTITNPGPAAVNDIATTTEDIAVTIAVLANDSDPDGDPLTVSAASAANGVVSRNANGTITYTPNANFNGTDTISYTISDGQGGTSNATVSVTVAAADDAPVNAVPGGQSGTEDGSIVFSTANGNAISISDVEGGIQTVTLDVFRGTLTLGGVAGLTLIQGDGTADPTMTFSGTVAAINTALQGLRFTPNPDFNGSSQLTIRTITNPAVASGFTNGGFELPNFTGGPTFHIVNESLVPGWDTDAADNQIEIWDSGFNNSPVGAIFAYEGDQFAEINATQAAALFQNFTPGVGANVSVQFAHRGRGGIDTMRVVATDLGADGVVGTADDAILLNEVFADNNTAWGAYTRQLTGSASGNTIRFEFRAVSTANGNDSFGNFVDGIRVVQGLSDLDTVALTVTPVADIVNDSVTTPEDTAIGINVLANDNFENPGRAVTAINGTAIAANGTVAVANGVVRLNADGTLNFAPTGNYNGTTSFTYTVTSNETTETATTTVIVTPVNDAPTTVGSLPSRTNLDANTVTVATAGAFADVDGTAFVYSAAGLPAGLTIDSATGVISGTINRSASQTGGGVYAVVVTARDPGGLSVAQSFGWTITNPGPVAVNDSASTAEDTAVTISVLANDSDPDGDPLTVTAASAANGIVVRNADGTLTYTANLNFNGTDTINYTISDGEGGISSATVTVTTNAANDAPVTVGIGNQATVDRQIISLPVAAAFSDVDGDTLTYGATGLPAGLTINAATGVISGTIDRSASQVAGGVYVVTVTAFDGRGGTVATSFSWSVTNPPPVARNDNVTVAEDTTITIVVLANDTDPDDDPLTVITANASHGTVTINPDGTLLYISQTNFNGLDTITYTISDGQGGTSTATVAVNVIAVNDAPTTTGLPNQNDAVSAAITVPVASAFADADGDTLSYATSGLPEGLTINAVTGVITGTLRADASVRGPTSNGRYEVTVFATDPAGQTVSTTFVWLVREVQPSANDDVAMTNEDTAVTIAVLTNDTDPDNDPLTIVSATAAHGTVTITGGTTLTFTPAADFNGVTTVTYTVSDGNGGFSTATVTVTVAAINDAPESIAIPSRSNADADVVSINLAGFFSDRDGDTLGYSVSGLPAGLVFDAVSGVIAGTIDRQASQVGGGLYTVTVIALDGAGLSASRTFGWTIIDPAPTAVNDSASTDEDIAVMISVLANDVDPDGDPLTVVSAVASNGTVTITPANQLIYTPNANFNGTDTIVYRISDGNGGQSTAAVTVVVAGTNDAPVATPDSTTTAEDTAVTISVLANDTDADDDLLTVTAASAANGVVTRNADGTLTYVPNANFNGTDTVTYEISDDRGGTATSVVTVSVTPANDPPIAVNDSATTNEDTPVTIAVLANDSDIDGNPLTVISATATNGAVVRNADGTLTYTPDTNFNGTDTISYTISDGQGGTAAAIVSVTVTAVNDAPIPVGTLAPRNNADANVVSVPTAGGFIDADGTPLTYAATGLPVGLSIDAITGVISGTIDRSASQDNLGFYTVIVTATDAAGLAATQQFNWTIANPVPIAVNDSATTTEDAPVTVTVLTNDSDPDGDPLTVIAASAANGSVVRNADGTLTYTPDANFDGTDTLTYTVSDGENGTATATVTITVSPVNDAPTPVGILAARTNLDGAMVSAATAGGFIDIDGTPLTYTATGLPAGLGINGTTGVISGTIDRSASQLAGGLYIVVVTATDPGGLSTTQTFGWTITNPVPVAVNDSVTTAEDTPVIISVLANDSDPDGDPLTVTSATAINGTVISNDNGTLTYTPNANFNGNDTISYTISDGQGGFADATVTVAITAVNDAPTARGAALSLTERDSATLSIPAATTFADIDGDILAYAATNLPTGLTIDAATGVISGTLDRSASRINGGVHAIVVTATDPNGLSVTRTITLTVTNPTPTADNDSATATEDMPVTIAVLANDSDPDGDPLTVTAATATRGTVTINANGTLTFVPNANFNGDDTISYTISDGEGGTSSATVVVTIIAVNDAPTSTPIAPQNDLDGAVALLPTAPNFTDIDGDTLTFTATGLPPGLTIDAATGVITGTIDRSASQIAGGVYPVVVTATDPAGAAGSLTFDWTITNAAPVAGNDSVTTAEDTPVTITVLANDSDRDNDPLTVTVATATRGTVVVNSDGTLTYTPAASFNGGDTISYTISDGQGGTSTATVLVTVTAVNDAPVAGALPPQADLDGTTILLSTGSAFSDVDRDALVFSATGLPAGLVIDAATGVISGTIDRAASIGGPALNGVYAVTVTVSDGAGGVAQSSFNWLVTNPAPVAANDTSTTLEDESTIVTVLANDVDPDGDVLTIVSATAPNGTVVINPDGTLTYTPNANYNGTDTISYVISDGQGSISSASAIVTVAVGAVNDAPVSTPIGDKMRVDGQTVAFSVAPNFSDPDGDTLTYSAIGLPPGLAIDAVTGLISGTLTANASQGGPGNNGVYSVTVTAVDGNGGTATSGYTATVIDIAPQAVNDSATTAEDTPLTIAVLANDVDPDGDPLTVVGAGALRGTVTVNPDNTLTYLSPLNFTGTDTITYVISDGNGGTSTATVEVTVTAVNDAPTTVGLPSRSNSNNQMVSINTAASFSDIDGDPLSYSIVGLPAGLVIDPATGVISGTIDAAASAGGPGANGVYPVTVTASDGFGGAVATTFTWTIANTPPLANADAATTAEDNVIVVDVTANDIDPDGNAGTPIVVVTASAARGTVVINPNGTLSYTPNANFNGTDTITYDIDDGLGGVSTGTATITVTPVNDAPTTLISVPPITAIDGQVETQAGAAAFADVDGDVLTYSATGLPLGLSIDPVTGVLSGTIDRSASQINGGAYTAVITATDAGGLSTTLTVLSTTSNPAPVTADDGVTLVEDTSATIAVLANDVDPDGDPLTVLAATATRGTVVINGNGTISYTPNTNFNGSDTISYTISDGQGGFADATVMVIVTPANDAPVADPVVPQNAIDASVISLPTASNFSDIEGDVLSYSVIGLPAGLTIDPVTGIIGGTIAPAASGGGVGGVYSVTVTASDGNGGTAATTFTWTVRNPAPVAIDDSVTTAEDTPVTFAVTGNDSDDDTFTVAAAGAVAGTVTVNADNTLTYTPGANFNGSDTITYTITDAQGLTATATVMVTVEGVNDGPLATPIAAQTTQDDTVISLATAANFTDPDGTPLGFAATGLPLGLTIDPVTGVISGTIDRAASAAGTGGVYTVTVVATDAGGASVASTFTITVANPVPVAVDDAVTVAEDTPTIVTVLGNDIDPDGDVLTVVSATAVRGTVTINGDGTLTYIPPADYVGTDSINYTIVDAQGATSSAVVVVTVTNINDAPVAGLIAPQTHNDGTFVSLPVATAFTDADNDALVFTATGLPAGLVIDAASGIISGTLAAGASVGAPANDGRYTVTVTATDPSGAAVSTNFVFTAVNVAPVASDDAMTIAEDTPVTITVLGNDTDADGDILSVVTASAGFGQVVINLDGTLTYTPNANFNGSDTISYTVSDGEGGSSSAVVAVTVTAVNDAPVATPIAPQADRDGDIVTLPTAANFVDADGDTLTFTAAGLPAGLTIDLATGIIAGTIDRTASIGGPATNGVYAVTVTATEAFGATTSTTFAYVVTNPVPQATADVASTSEDTPVTVNVLGNDSDPDGDTLVITAVSAASGTVVNNGDGTLTYTPNPNFSGQDLISYTISDGQGGTATATATITVIAVNDAPVTASDATATSEDTPVTLNVLDNDGDVDGDPLTVTTATAPHGTVVVNPDGTLTYTPAADFSGSDVITYTVSDGQGGITTATVDVMVNAVNDAPVAVVDAASTTEDSAITVAVLANDTDIDGDPLTVTSATAANGSVVINGDGTLSYTPNTDFFGSDTISYTISDGRGGTNSAIATVMVAGVDDAPVAVADIASIDEDGSVVIAVLANDSDVDGDPLTITAASAANGTVTINADGTVTYTPNANFAGTDTITYTLSDGTGAATSTTVTVTIASVNDAPVAVVDVATTAEDTPLTIAVLANDTDADGDPLTVVAASAASGTVVVNPDGTITYVPNSNFNGTDTLSYTVSDGRGGTTVATIAVMVTVAPVADQPVAGPVVATTVEDVPVTIAPLATATDPDTGDVLTISAAMATNGTVVINPDGTVTYTPNADFNGTDTITYTISDGSGGFTTASFPVTVTAVEDAPVANPDSARTDEDIAITIAVLGNDIDIDGDPLTVIAASAANGTVALNPDGTLRYTPAPQFVGTDTISYTITDGNGGTASATVTVTVVAANDPPTVVSDTARVPVDTPTVIDPLANDSDPEGNPLTLVSATAGVGTVVVRPDGTLLYTPVAGFSGVDTISYTVTDSQGGSATGTITVTVSNADPVAGADTAVAVEDTPVTIAVLANDSDVDGDPLTVVAASAVNGMVVVNADGTLTYTPRANFNGADTISYTVSDGRGGTTTATVAVVVTAANDAPVAVVDAATTIEDTPVTIAVLANDSDVDGDPLTVVAASAINGMVVVNADGTLTYMPRANFNGSDTINYTVSDGRGGTTTATVAVVVTAANDAPVAVVDAATVVEDTPVTIAVLANDSDVDGDALSVTGATAANGTVVVNADGSLTYTPRANFNGSDTISYTVSDGRGGTTTATVAVVVTAANDAPVAVSDAATAIEDTPVTIAVLANDSDSDVDGDALSVTAATATNGAVVINPDGSLTYTPRANFNGSDTISYTVSDGRGGMSTATVAVVVTAANDAPVDAPETVAAVAGTPVTITVLANAGDIDGDPLRVISATATAGAVTINPDGTLTYTAPFGFIGTATITYVVGDASGGSTTSTATVTVTAAAAAAPTADINALLAFGRLPQLLTGRQQTLFDHASPGAPPLIDHGSIPGFRSLNGTPGLIVDLPIMTTVAGIVSLRGFGTIDPTASPIGQEIARLDDATDLRFGNDRGFDRRPGDFTVEGFTGFSVRGIGENGHVMIESVVRGTTIYVEIRDIGGRDARPFVEHRLRMADGRAVPGWIQFDRRGLAIIDRMPDVETIRIIIRSIREDGSHVDTPLVIQGATGEIELDREQPKVASAMTLDQLLAAADDATAHETARLLNAFGGTRGAGMAA